MGRRKTVLLLAFLITLACETEDSAQDGSDAQPGDMRVEDGGEVLPDRVDKVPFAPTGCSADPASALVEVRLTDLEILSSVSTAPAADSALSIDEMATVMRQVLQEQGYPVDNLAVASRSTSEYGGLDLMRLEGGDPFARGVFHRITARPVVVWAGDFLSCSKRYFPPDPLEAAAAVLYEPASNPTGIYREDSSDTCDLEEMETVVDELNRWGSTWAGLAGGSWTDRTFREIWDLVLGTGVFNGFAACGPYEVFVFGLGPTGGSYSGDVDLIRLDFVLTGLVDQSRL